MKIGQPKFDAHWLVQDKVALITCISKPEPMVSAWESAIEKLAGDRVIELVIDMTRAHVSKSAIDQLNLFLQQPRFKHEQDTPHPCILIAGQANWSALKMETSLNNLVRSRVEVTYNQKLAIRALEKRGHHAISFPMSLPPSAGPAASAQEIFDDGMLVLRVIRGALSMIQSAATMRANLFMARDLPPGRSALVDVRQVNLVRSGLENWQLMDRECGDLSSLTHPRKQILLCRPEDLEFARFFCDWVGSKGGVAFACSDLGDASIWLDQDPAELESRLKRMSDELGPQDAVLARYFVENNVRGTADDCYLIAADGRVVIRKASGAMNVQNFIQVRRDIDCAPEIAREWAGLYDIRDLEDIPKRSEMADYVKRISREVEEHKTSGRVALLANPQNHAQALLWAASISNAGVQYKAFSNLEMACAWLEQDSGDLIISLDKLELFNHVSIDFAKAQVPGSG